MTTLEGHHWYEKYLFWIILSCFFLLLSGFFSYYGLFGWFQIVIWGLPGQFIFDPDIAYLVSGLTFFDQDKIFWAGHPGFSLMLSIQLITKIYYWLSIWIFNLNIPFETFIAKNIFWVIWISKMFITTVHLFTFYILYLLAEILLKDKLSSYVAVIAYATSINTLYFINKIAPEPFIVVFTLLTIYFIWKYYENLENKYYSFIYLLLSSCCSAAAFYTKITLITPFIVLLPAYLLLQKRNIANHEQILPLSKRALSSGLFMLMSIPFFLLGSIKLNWSNFISYWSYWSSNSPLGNSVDISILKTGSSQYSDLSRIGEKVITIIYGYAKYLILDFSPNNWLPDLSTASGQYNSSELVFIILSITGFAFFWQHNKNLRSYLNIFILLFISTLPLITYRHAWSQSSHYCCINIAMGAIFIGYLAKIVMEYIKIQRPLSNPITVFVLAISFAIVIHTMSWIFIFDAKINDIKQYQTKWSIYYNALKEVDYGHKIALIQTSLPPFLGDINNYDMSGRLAKEVANFFVYIPYDINTININEQIINQTKIQLIISYDLQKELILTKASDYLNVP